MSTTERQVTANVSLKLGAHQVQMAVDVSEGPTALADFLPLARTICEASVHVGVQDAAEQGESVSCTKGCGACCRQIVPISEVEARMIRDLMEGMPEPRRSQIRQRFAEARDKLQATGLLEPLLNRADWPLDFMEKFGLDYFRQGVPCPFLEEESCSIYLDRPLTCREYLVTSPAACCSQPTRATVETVKIPMKVWPALARFHKSAVDSPFIRWVPLILAPEWADSHPEDLSTRPGVDMLREFLENLSGKVLPEYVPFEVSEP